MWMVEGWTLDVDGVGVDGVGVDVDGVGMDLGCGWCRSGPWMWMV